MTTPLHLNKSNPLPQGPPGITTGFSDLLIGYQVTQDKEVIKAITDELSDLITTMP
ncbi:hypothetical protein HOH45_09020 [bacterium]|jgi:hypothetical protein|nr:hypothetical protein [bacterium]